MVLLPRSSQLPLKLLLFVQSLLLFAVALAFDLPRAVGAQGTDAASSHRRATSANGFGHFCQDKSDPPKAEAFDVEFAGQHAAAPLRTGGSKVAGLLPQPG